MPEGWVFVVRLLWTTMAAKDLMELSTGFINPSSEWLDLNGAEHFQSWQP